MIEAAAPRPKPRLRGVSHQVAALVAAPAVVALWAEAGSFPARLGAVIYGVSLFALFAISALYHRPTWPPRARDLVGRIDQAAIFLLIAGTYTPFGLLLWPVGGHTLLMVIWGGAIGGVVLSLLWPSAPKPLMAAIYVLFGWSFVAIGPSLFRVAGPLVLALVVLGGIVYTLGAIIYSPPAAQPLSPDLWLPQSLPPLRDRCSNAALCGRIPHPARPGLNLTQS